MSGSLQEREREREGERGKKGKTKYNIKRTVALFGAAKIGEFDLSRLIHQDILCLNLKHKTRTQHNKFYITYFDYHN